MKIYDTILPLVDSYDAFFVDVYGVIFNGIRVYDEALSALDYLKKAGKSVIILSNTTELSESAKIGYTRRGLVAGQHYDKFVTSGEFLNRSLKANSDKFFESVGHLVKTVKCIFFGNGEVFKGTPLQKVDDINDADIMYVGFPRTNYGPTQVDELLDSNGNRVTTDQVLNVDWRTVRSASGNSGLPEIVHDLEICLQKDKTLLVANPDIFAHTSINNQKHLVLTQGAVGYYYEKMGGKAIFTGKPYSGIFEFAKTFVPSSTRIAMIGDTPWTDILGANNSGIDSILVTTGVADEFVSDHKDRESGIDYLLENISLKMNYSLLKNVVPTHVIKRLQA